MSCIREIRKAASLTQFQLAQRSGVSRFRLCMAETDSLQLRPEELEAINKAVAPEIERARHVLSNFQGLNCVAL